MQNKGFTLPISCSSSDVCALCSMHAMLTVRYQLGLPSAPHDPVFTFSSGVPLTKNAFVTQTRMYLRSVVPNPSDYSGHSFRAGSATTAAMAGLGDWEIQLLGRWTSNAYLRYIRAPRSLLLSFSKKLTRQVDLSALTPHSGYISNVI